MTTVTACYESFLRIIIDIPIISTDEVIDRYTRGLKMYISKELCTRNYGSLTTLMSDVISGEASKTSYSRSIQNDHTKRAAVPMDISNTRLSL